jgi:peptidoglycan/LPS O-acetylase OafA/YrhL
MCFSLYAWHGLFFFSNVFNLYSHPLLIGKLLYYYFFTFIISAFTYRYIEFGSEKDWKKLFLLKSA